MNLMPFLIVGVIIALPVSAIWYILWLRILEIEQRLTDLETLEQLE